MRDHCSRLLSHKLTHRVASRFGNSRGANDSFRAHQNPEKYSLISSAGQTVTAEIYSMTLIMMISRKTHRQRKTCSRRWKESPLCCCGTANKDPTGSRGSRKRTIAKLGSESLLHSSCSPVISSSRIISSSVKFSEYT